MHHRILAWNRVEGERNTHNIGWVGGQNGFIDLHKVIGSATRWNVVVNILLHPEVILVVEREPGQKDILLGSRNGIFHDLAVRIDAAHLVTGFFAKPHCLATWFGHNGDRPGIRGLLNLEFGHFAAGGDAGNGVSDKFRRPHIVVRPVPDVDGDATGGGQREVLDLPVRRDFADGPGSLTRKPNRLTIVSNPQPVGTRVDLAGITIQADVILFDNVAVLIQPGDLSRKLQGYPEPTRRIKPHAVRAATGPH